jgi:hypothetical protein
MPACVHDPNTNPAHGPQTAISRFDDTRIVSPTMKQQTKRLCLVVAAQTARLAVGLWMQRRFIRSSIRRAVENEACSGLEVWARECLSLLDSRLAGMAAPESSRLKRLKNALQAKRAGTGNVMILDPQWRVIMPGTGEDRTQHTGASWGYKVSLSAVAGTAAPVVYRTGSARGEVFCSSCLIPRTCWRKSNPRSRRLRREPGGPSFWHIADYRSTPR